MEGSHEICNVGAQGLPIFCLLFFNLDLIIVNNNCINTTNTIHWSNPAPLS